MKTVHTHLRPWTPFVKKEMNDPTPQQVSEVMRATGYSLEQTLAAFAQNKADSVLWENSRYAVFVRDMGTPPDGWPRMTHLSIKRHDKKAVGPERFRDFQRIKNELCGPECEAAEIYPAESRLVDTANQYHLWVLHDGRFPFGFGSRLIFGESTAVTGQQPFEEERG